MAKKVIRLTESDLEKIVKRVIKEQSEKFKVNATIGSSPEVVLNIENGKKTLLVRSSMGFGDQKFIIETEFPIRKKDQPVFATYKGNNIFELLQDGGKKVMAKIVGVAKP